MVLDGETLRDITERAKRSDDEAKRLAAIRHGQEMDRWGRERACQDIVRLPDKMREAALKKYYGTYVGCYNPGMRGGYQEVMDEWVGGIPGLRVVYEHTTFKGSDESPEEPVFSVTVRWDTEQEAKRQDHWGHGA